MLTGTLSLSMKNEKPEMPIASETGMPMNISRKKRNVMSNMGDQPSWLWARSSSFGFSGKKMKDRSRKERKV